MMSNALRHLLFMVQEHVDRVNIQLKPRIVPAARWKRPRRNKHHTRRLFLNVRVAIESCDGGSSSCFPTIELTSTVADSWSHTRRQSDASVRVRVLLVWEARVAGRMRLSVALATCALTHTPLTQWVCAWTTANIQMLYLIKVPLKTFHL